MANLIGRPLKFKSPEEITQKAEVYFKNCEDNNLPITITGLAISLDTSRETLMDYEDNRGASYSYAVKKAKDRCEAYAEQRLWGSGNPAAPIFALKNYGWTDRQESKVEVRGKLQIEVVTGIDREAVGG